MERYLLITTLFIGVFLAYLHLMIGTGAASQQSYTYWNLLADEFLQGRIYLSDPPQIVDLTFHQGRWFVPMPPLPAIIMMPLAFFVGGVNIDAGYFSIFFSAITVVLLYLILEQFSTRRWVDPSIVSRLTLTVLFAFGTPHLWVGIHGRVWFVSQIVTVTFIALSIFTALRTWSPWFVGIFLGLAITSRPNAIMTWPFVLAIAMEIMKEKQGSVNWKRLMDWSIRSIMPMFTAIGCLLLYNQMRFGYFFDFGYVTINGNPTIVENAQRYGIFSAHFILTNLKVMFINFPALDFGSRWPIVPSSVGMSIFLTTPAFVYLFQPYERKWWILGAWLSVLLNFALLVLYHNTGANQFGYRYVLDAIVPLVILLTVTLPRKSRLLFNFLVLISIGFNIYGAYWFINR